MDKKVYRGDRRNAARKAGALSKWRDRPRIRTGLKGMRFAPHGGKRLADGKNESYLVYTFIVGN